ncbi:MAG TPA: sigma-70 family RNA polymerase sigma factor [Actinobacteria bacterium]|nr:sigma-70 family RNA polymerase sigma factor [Actinomycetota bacterium]
MSDNVIDKDLVTRYLDGDKSAFSELVKRHKNLIYNLAFRLVGIAEEAEDLTQEIFIRLLDKVSMWRGEAKFSTWLYRLAINHCRDHLRRRHLETSEINESLCDPHPGPAQETETREVRCLIENALMELPIDFRAVVYLRDIGSFSYGEIASILEIELGTVKSRLARGRRSLARALEADERDSQKDREQIDAPDHLRG